MKLIVLNYSWYLNDLSVISNYLTKFVIKTVFIDHSWLTRKNINGKYDQTLGSLWFLLMVASRMAYFQKFDFCLQITNLPAIHLSITLNFQIPFFLLKGLN